MTSAERALSTWEMNSRDQHVIFRTEYSFEMDFKKREERN